MERHNKIGRYEFLVEPFHCDFSNRIFMGHLGNHLLNAADFHSNERGFGMHFLNGIRKTWVLSRLAIEVNEMPVAYTRLSVETWVDSVMRFFTQRNFKISDHETGKIYGYGRSVWAMIDTETRQPADILAIKEGSIAEYVDKETICPIAASSRVRMSDEGQWAGKVETHYSDVDVNGHINSVKYVEHLLDLMPEAWHRTHRISRIDVAYVAESHFGDVLNYYCETTGEGKTAYRIMKQRGEEPPLEACRVEITTVKSRL